MVQTKKMNESAFAKVVEKINSHAELIRSKQDQKQVIIDDFEKEKARYKQGKISQSALATSVRLTNAQLLKIDKSIRDTILKTHSLLGNAGKAVSNQSPKAFRAHLYGVSGKSKGKKKSTKRTVNPGIQRILSEEKKLDRKYQK